MWIWIHIWFYDFLRNSVNLSCYSYLITSGLTLVHIFLRSPEVFHTGREREREVCVGSRFVRWTIVAANGVGSPGLRPVRRPRHASGTDLGTANIDPLPQKQIHSHAFENLHTYTWNENTGTWEGRWSVEWTKKVLAGDDCDSEFDSVLRRKWELFIAW